MLTVKKAEIPRNVGIITMCSILRDRIQYMDQYLHRRLCYLIEHMEQFAVGIYKTDIFVVNHANAIFDTCKLACETDSLIVIDHCIRCINSQFILIVNYILALTMEKLKTI